MVADPSPLPAAVTHMERQTDAHLRIQTWTGATEAPSGASSRFERYAGDAVCQCRSEAQAKLEWRFAECRLELHPEKAKILYCTGENWARGIPAYKVRLLGIRILVPAGEARGREGLRGLQSGHQCGGGQDDPTGRPGLGAVAAHKADPARAVPGLWCGDSRLGVGEAIGVRTAGDAHPAEIRSDRQSAFCSGFRGDGSHPSGCRSRNHVNLVNSSLEAVNAGGESRKGHAFNPCSTLDPPNVNPTVAYVTGSCDP